MNQNIYIVKMAHQQIQDISYQNPSWPSEETDYLSLNSYEISRSS